MTNPLLKLHRVSREYPGETPTAALTDVTLAIAEGDFVAVTGQSGSGKSTLLNILGLLDTPTAGDYSVDGLLTASLREEDLDRLRSGTFGFVFQESHVFPADDVRRNVSLGLRISGMPHREQGPIVDQAISRLGLDHRRAATAHSLSGGERQRVAIARTLTMNPRIILADEPTGNLDAANSHAVIQKLRELNDDGVTVIVVTHDPTVAAASDRVITMADGRITADERRRGPLLNSTSDETRDEKKRIHESNAFVGRNRQRRERLAAMITDSLSSIATHGARTALLVAAFTLGSGGLVTAVGLSESASQQVSSRLSAAELDEIRLNAPLNTEQAQIEEWSETISGLNGVKAVGQKVSLSGQSTNVQILPGQPSGFSGPVVGADSGLLALSDVTTHPASAAALLDPRLTGGRVALISEAIQDDLGIGAIGPGSQLWVGGQSFDIVGIVSPSLRDPLLNNAIILPAHLAAAMSPVQKEVVIRSEPGMPPRLREAVPIALSPGDPASIEMSAAADLRNLKQGVATDLQSLVTLTAALTLTLAVLSAGATMYLSTRSRIGEIGLRRSLGMSRHSISTLFVLEGGALGLIGGLTGASVGLLIITAITVTQGWIPVLSPLVVPVGLASGLATGVIASVIPAVRAARIDPAQAVRTAG